MRKLLAMKGLPGTDYRVTELLGSSARFDCLKRGECDAVPLGQPDDLIAVSQGYTRLGASTEAMPAFQFQVIAARRSWAATHSGAIVRFVRALGRAFRYIRDPANRAETLAALIELTGSSEDIARQTLALYFEPDRGVLPKRAEIDPEGLAQVIAFMGEAGLIERPLPPPRRFMDLQYLRAAGVR
jgi:ABC-type nitrate/sulfonate/bicarbonate transport system substrate-binding protein